MQSNRTITSFIIAIATKPIIALTSYLSSNDYSLKLLSLIVKCTPSKLRIRSDKLV